MKVKCEMCNGTGNYWFDEKTSCKTCEGTGKVTTSSPTTENKEWWLEANGRPGNNFGKWLLFVNKNKINDTWTKIRQETVDENLGVGSKVSTKKGWVSNGMPENYVICCYTPEEKLEVDRVRNRLSELGFTEKLGYKTNEATVRDSDELLYRA